MWLTIVMFLCAFAASGQTPQSADLSTLEGRVVNVVTDEPVGKASIVLVHTEAAPGVDSWTKDYAVYTDASGKFAFNDVSPGKYRLRASRHGFIDMEYGARASRRPGTLLDLTHPQNQKSITIRLTPHGVIAGHVLDADGEAVPRASVQILSSRYVNGKKMLSTVSLVSTNDLGEYRCAGLAPGKYYVYAQDDLERPRATSAMKEEYVPVYYPGATDSAGASPVLLTVGAQAAGIDMLLRRAPTSTVRGHVVMALAGVRGTPTVTFVPRVDHDTAAVGTHRTSVARVDSDNRFEVRNLTPGSYSAMAAIPNGGIWAAGQSVRVDVAGENLDGVVLTISNGVRIDGRIEVAGRPAQDIGTPVIKLVRNGTAMNVTTRVAQDRTFRIDNLSPDRYRLEVAALAEGFYTKSIRAGETDVMYSGLDVNSAAPAIFDVLVSRGAATVSGVALSSDTGQPVSGATVVLIPADK